MSTLPPALSWQTLNLRQEMSSQDISQWHHWKVAGFPFHLRQLTQKRLKKMPRLNKLYRKSEPVWLFMTKVDCLGFLPNAMVRPTFQYLRDHLPLESLSADREVRTVQLEELKKFLDYKQTYFINDGARYPIPTWSYWQSTLTQSGRTLRGLEPKELVKTGRQSWPLQLRRCYKDWYHEWGAEVVQDLNSIRECTAEEMKEHKIAEERGTRCRM